MVNKLKVFSHMVSNADRQKEEMAFGKKLGGTEKEERKNSLGYRVHREGCGIQEKVIPGKMREFCCHMIFLASLLS